MTGAAPRRVLITAGAGGIGLAMARRFAAEGAQVLVVDADAAAVARLPAGIAGIAADVTDEGAIADALGRMVADWGGVDVVCANAGTAGPTAAVEDIALAEWRACIAVNLDAAFLCARHAVPHMKQAGRGVILITSSTAGLHGYPFRTPYAAAKWAVIGLAKSLAMELGSHGVRVNAICPGSVNGPRMDGVIAREAARKGVREAEIRAGYAAGTAMRSFVDAEDIAEMAAFLASDAARFVTGQAVSVDGFVFNPDP